MFKSLFSYLTSNDNPPPSNKAVCEKCFGVDCNHNKLSEKLKVGEYWIHKETPEWYAIIEKIEGDRFVNYRVFGDGDPYLKSLAYPTFLERYKHFPTLHVTVK